MNQDDLRGLSQIRVEEARALIAAGMGSGAYYLAGYAVECALKAFIARRTQAGDFPSKQLVLDAHTHNVEKLVSLAELKAERDADKHGDPIRNQNWGKVNSWSESDRYEFWTLDQARSLYDAINDADHGVLTWVVSRW